MYNPRKKYINIEEMSSGEIYAPLDSIESDHEDEGENLMNDSDTEFHNEANNPILVSEASMHVTNEDTAVEADNTEVETDTIDKKKEAKK